MADTLLLLVMAVHLSLISAQTVGAKELKQINNHD